MKQFFIGIVFLALLLSGGLHALAQPSVQEGDPLDVRISVNPTEVQQGKTATIRVFEVNGRKIDKIEASFLGNIFALYPTLDGEWIGFLGVDMEAERGEQSLDLYIYPSGSAQPQRERVTVPVVWGAFTTQNINVSNELMPLLDPELNQAEFNELARVHDRITDERFFLYFIPPITGPMISEFGGIRNYNNNSLQGRHTGIDFRANTGDAVRASADGRVIFSQRLPIHGNHIIVDHGWGVLTGYSHLSERLVVPGQLVRQGETIGLVGATGRVEGPHLHFEVVINGYWVDPEQFLATQMPPVQQ